MSKLVIVDTGVANISSVRFAFERLGCEPVQTADPQAIADADRVILPGVGTAMAGMRSIQEKGLADQIRNLQVPVLGICLGMQIMAEQSDEGHTPCLGIVPGTVSQLQVGDGDVLPHMGWNTVEASDGSRLFDGISASERFYFVHSYAMPVGPNTIATGRYGSEFAAAVSRDNFFGVQFHPERSGSAGARLLKNFLEIQ